MRGRKFSNRSCSTISSKRFDNHGQHACEYSSSMITAGHVVLYSRDPEADREFFQKVLKYPHIDAGDGWLIFKLPPTELGIHPTEGAESHEFMFMCEDLVTTMAELTGKGIMFSKPVT